LRQPNLTVLGILEYIMAPIIEEHEISLQPITGKKIGMVGYGSQGRAQALNARDGGADVKVSLKPNSRSRTVAETDGFPVLGHTELSIWADVLVIAVPDMNVKEALDALALRAGHAIVFLHGFAVHFKLIALPEFVDVALVSPAGPGPALRSEYVDGGGFASLNAVAQDYSGNARGISLAYARLVGCAKAGVIQSTFAEETETDLFGEQVVLCGGIPELIKSAFATLVENGYQPEVAYLECVHQVKLITDLIYRGGLTHMRNAISGTAEWGAYRSGPKIIGNESRNAMENVLKEIRGGEFAKTWIDESIAGGTNLAALRQAESAQLIESVGSEVRKRMSFFDR
jgi:ketol-acid reductoisomerase